MFEGLGPGLLALPVPPEADRGLRLARIDVFAAAAPDAPLKTWRFALGRLVEPERAPGSVETIDPSRALTPAPPSALARVEAEEALELIALELVDATTDLVVASLVDGGALDIEALGAAEITLRAVIHGAEADAIARVEARVSVVETPGAAARALYEGVDRPWAFAGELVAGFYAARFAPGALEIHIAAFETDGDGDGNGDGDGEDAAPALERRIRLKAF